MLKIDEELEELRQFKENVDGADKANVVRALIKTEPGVETADDANRMLEADIDAAANNAAVTVKTERGRKRGGGRRPSGGAREEKGQAYRGRGLVEYGGGWEAGGCASLH